MTTEYVTMKDVAMCVFEDESKAIEHCENTGVKVFFNDRQHGTLYGAEAKIKLTDEVFFEVDTRIVGPEDLRDDDAS